MAVVIILFNQPRLMENDSFKFIVNQSMIDAIESVLLVLSRRNLIGNFALPYVYSYSDGNFFDELVCKVWNLDTFQWALIVCSTFNLVVLTIVKYIKIVHPFWYKVRMTNRVVNSLLVLPWFLGLLYQFGLFSIRADVIGNKCVYPLWPHEMMGIIMGCVALVVQFILPLMIMLFCYIKIFLTIKQRRRSLEYITSSSASNISVVRSSSDNISTDISMDASASVQVVSPIDGTIPQQGPSHNNLTEKRSNPKDDKIQMKVIKMLTIVCLGFFLCWVINQLMFFLVNIHAIPSPRGTLLYYISVILANANCCINPFIYLCQFRKYFCFSRSK